MNNNNQCYAGSKVIQEIIYRIMSELTRPETMSVIKDRLSYSNVFSIVVTQMHPLYHAGLAINEIATINRCLSESLGLKVFYEYGEVFCQCHDVSYGASKKGIFGDIRARDRLPCPPTYTPEDAEADINAVVRIYNMYKKTLDSELASRRRIRIHAAKIARNYSVIQLFTTKKPNNQMDEMFDAPLRINQLNYDPFIREKQWQMRVAKEISSRIGVPLIEIQGAHVSLGDVILTID